jgi:hypothetical protein
MENNKPHITGREGSPIDLELAASWTKHYRDRHPEETISQFFGKEILENILAQPGCLGIRFYYAYDEPHGGKKHLIIAGAMADGTDQIHTQPLEVEAAAEPGAEPVAGGAAPKLYTVGEMSSPCPGSPGCPTNVLTGTKS